MQILFKQIYLTYCWDTNRMDLGVMKISFSRGHLPPDAF